jgi:hypothetical protein
MTKSFVDMTGMEKMGRTVRETLVAKAGWRTRKLNGGRYLG